MSLAPATAPPRPDRGGTSGPVRVVLDNGLRVVLWADRAWGRVASGLTHGVGYRHERPGEEGLAHLVEHLLFEGGPSVPEGRFREPIHAAGGLASGTTHQDYTDLYQTFPEHLLELVLFQEADRLRRPRLSRLGLQRQLDELEHELRAAKEDKPYAGLPWPLLPQVMFSSFQNAHDGFGDVDRLRRLGTDDVEGFFWEHYAPGNAVLSIVGAFDPEECLDLVQRHLGAIPSRPVRDVPPLREPALTEDRWAGGTDPLISTPAGAIGLRLPDGGRDLRGYLAHQVVAALLPSLLHGRGVGRVKAGCGFFGPLDVVSPDALVVTAVDASLADDPRRLGDAVRERLSGLTADDVAGWGWARETVAQAYAADHLEITRAARSLARYETLWSDAADRPARIVDALADLGTDDVLDAAHALGAQRVAGVGLTQGPRGPAPFPSSRAPGHAGPRPGRGPAAPALTPPRPGPQRPLSPPVTLADTLADGTRLVVVRDLRLRRPLLRWRAELGPVLWSDPRAARAAAAALDAALRAGLPTAPPPAGALVTTDGEELLARAETSEAGLQHLLGTLGHLEPGSSTPHRAPLQAGPEPVVPDVPLRLDPAALATALRRTSWASAPGADRRHAAPVLVLLTPGDPQAMRELVRQAWGTRRPSGSDDPAPPGAAAPGRAASGADAAHQLIEVPQDGAAQLTFELSVPSAPGTAGEAARYLATAAWGAYHDSRLVRRFPWRPTQGVTAALAGRDRLAGVDRAFVRGFCPAGAGAEVLATVTEEMARTRTDPFTADEVDRARTYCTQQLRAVLDSPYGLADSLVSALGLGRDPRWLWEIGSDLGRVRPADVTAAAQELLGDRLPSLTLVGAVPRGDRPRLSAPSPPEER